MATKKISYGHYTIINRGTPHSFNPNKKVIDPYTNQETTLLEVHKEKVKDENSSLVYILDDNGEMVAA